MWKLSPIFISFLVTVLLIGCSQKEDSRVDFQTQLRQLTSEYEMSKEIPDLVKEFDFPLKEMNHYYGAILSWTTRELEAYVNAPQIQKLQFEECARWMIERNGKANREEVQQRSEFCIKLAEYVLDERSKMSLEDQYKEASLARKRFKSRFRK